MVLNIYDDAKKIDLLESISSGSDVILARLNASKYIDARFVTLDGHLGALSDAVKQNLAIWHNLTALIGDKP